MCSEVPDLDCNVPASYRCHPPATPTSRSPERCRLNAERWFMIPPPSTPVGSSGTVALARLDPNAEQVTLLSQTELPGKTYSAQLIPTIRELLAAHNITIAEIATIVVTNGPGSFTGIRIGLCYRQRPGRSPLDAHPRRLAASPSSPTIKAENSRTSAAALDANRGEFYSARLLRNPQRATPQPRPSAQRAALLGPELAICEDTPPQRRPTATLVAPATAIDALHFALPRLRARDLTTRPSPSTATTSAAPTPKSSRDPTSPTPHRSHDRHAVRPMHARPTSTRSSPSPPPAPKPRTGNPPTTPPTSPPTSPTRPSSAPPSSPSHRPEPTQPGRNPAFAAASLLLTPDPAGRQNLMPTRLHRRPPDRPPPGPRRRPPPRDPRLGRSK